MSEITNKVIFFQKRILSHVKQHNIPDFDGAGIGFGKTGDGLGEDDFGTSK